MRGWEKLFNLVLALAAIGLGFIAQRCLVELNLSSGLIVYTLAALLFVYAFRNRQEKERLPTRADVSWGNRKLGLILLAASLLSGLYALHLFGRNTHPNLAWTFHLMSIALLMATVYVLSSKQRVTGGKRSITRPSPLAPCHLLLTTCLLIAAFIRLCRFDSIPYGTWYDEADAGLQARQILRNPNYRPVFWASMNHPAHLLYLYALSLQLFGESTQALRLVSVAFGLAGVIAAYLFGREFFNANISLVLAFLIAVSRWHVNFSRIAMTGIETPFFELLTLYFLLKGMRSGRLPHFAWAGLALGFGLCFYTAFRLFPFVIAVFLGCWFLRERSRSLGFCLLAFTLAALLVIAPVAQFAIKNPNRFWFRTYQASIFNDKSISSIPQALAENAQKHLLMFNYRGDPNGRHNIPGHPMLDFATSVLFVLGLAYSLSHLCRLRYFLLVTWFLITLCGGIFSLTFEAPQSLRSIGSLPAAYTLACVPFGLLRHKVQGLRGKVQGVRWQALYLVPCTLLLAFIGWDNYDAYFNEQALRSDVLMSFNTQQAAMARFINEQNDCYIYIRDIDHPVIRFMVRDRTNLLLFHDMRTLPVRELVDRDIIYLLDDLQRVWVPYLRHYYPKGTLREVKDPFGLNVTLFQAYAVSKDEVNGILGLVGQYHQLEGEGTLMRHDSQVSFDWREREPPLEPPFEVIWSGMLFIPQTNTHTIGVEATGPFTLQVDYAPVLEGRGDLNCSLQLARGFHAIELKHRQYERGKIELYWVRGGKREPIPRMALCTVPPMEEGLLASYYRGSDWSGPPEFVRVDPVISFRWHPDPLPTPWSVEWRGKILIPKGGEYRFGTHSNDYSAVHINGRVVVENPGQAYREGKVRLEAGKHEIRVRYRETIQYSELRFYWMPPGGVREVVPSKFLRVR